MLFGTFDSLIVSVVFKDFCVLEDEASTRVLLRKWVLWIGVGLVARSPLITDDVGFLKIDGISRSLFVMVVMGAFSTIEWDDRIAD